MRAVHVWDIRSPRLYTSSSLECKAGTWQADFEYLDSRRRRRAHVFDFEKGQLELGGRITGRVNASGTPCSQARLVHDASSGRPSGKPACGLGRLTANLIVGNCPLDLSPFHTETA